MKIVQANNLYRKYGGSESVLFNTIELLSENGHTVIPFCILDSSNKESEFSKYFVSKRSYLHNKFYSLAAKIKFKRLVENEKPDLVHIHNIIGGLTFSILSVCKKFQIPVVATIHDFRLLCPAYVFIDGKNNICEKCKNGNLINCICNKCAPEGFMKSCLITIESYQRNLFIPFNDYITRFIFVSDFSKSKFSESKFDISSKSHSLYNFTSQFEFSQKNQNENCFLFIGRLSREKGLLLLFEAFKQLPNLRLLVAGDGKLKDKLISIKSDNIELLGYKSREELKSLIKNSYFLIVPSECYENNPMSIVESFSLGTPVIGSDLGGIPEIILTSGGGFLFKNRDINSLIDVLTKAASIEDDVYSSLCMSAFNFAEKQFNSQTHYNKLINIYQDAINNY